MKGNMSKSLRGFFAVLSVAVSSGLAAPAGAQDTIKVAVGQIDAWANQVPTLGMKAGIFQKHGIVLENYGTQGAGETLQAVISGSADIGIGVGTPGAMRAFAKGAPVRVLAAAYTGVEDIYWFVPANSPIKSVKDITTITPSPIRPTVRPPIACCARLSPTTVSRRSRPRPADHPGRSQ